MNEKASEAFMREAVALSKKGFPAPNPRVGCVIVSAGEIVGRGFHAFAGGPHAEIVALQMAGDRARNADVYVTLEPCNHFGRTPPCAQALVDAGIRRLFYAVSDPNPNATGGAKALEEMGIEVRGGLLRELAERNNRPFLVAMRKKRPYIIIKAAVTLDGRISREPGKRERITGIQAIRAGHRLRAEMGSVLVGSGTVQVDDPVLTARISGVVNQPARIILDPEPVLTGNERVFQGEGETLWLVKGPARHRQAIPIPWQSGRFDLKALLKLLFERGITGILVEGGGTTIRSFLEAGLYDQIELFMAPKIFGRGTSWVGEEAPLNVTLPFQLVRCRRLGPDLQLSYEIVGS